MPRRSIVLLTIALPGFIGCSPVSAPPEVLFHGSGIGTSSANIVVLTPSGPMHREGLALPLKRADGLGIKMSGFKRGQVTSILVQSNSQDRGASVTCAIEVDGRTVVEDIKTGPFAVAKCEAKV